MYYGHVRLCVCVVCVCLCMCVCLSAAACLHYSTDPDVAWRNGGGCLLVVHHWADLQSVHGLRCYGNTRNVWQSPAVIHQAHRMKRQALCMYEICYKIHACRQRLPSPAMKSMHLLHTPFHFVHTLGVLKPNVKC